MVSLMLASPAVRSTYGRPTAVRLVRVMEHR